MAGEMVSADPQERKEQRPIDRMGRAMHRIVMRVPMIVAMMLFIVTACFFFVHLAPGDLADILGSQDGASLDDIIRFRQAYGLDQPIYVQYVRYIGQLLTLNLGYSPAYGAPVFDLVMARVPPSLLLMGTSLTLSVVVGVAIGTISAVHQGRALDSVISGTSMVALAIPLFWLGLMLVVVFSIKLRWLPASGMVDLFSRKAGLAYAADVAMHMVLPVVTLAIHHIGVYVRLTRAAVLEVQSLDFVRIAVAKGLTPARVRWHYMLRNALLPVVTMTGLQIGTLLGGAVVVETIFAWPGIGRLAYDAVLKRDFNLLLGILFLSSFLVIVANLVTDFVYSLLDPRIEL